MEIPYVEASGTNYEIGCAIGEHLREEIKKHNEHMKGFFSQIEKKVGQDLKSFSKGIEKLTAKYFPHYLDELRGMADGAGVPLHDILLISGEEELVDISGRGCTTIAYSCRDGILLGHNDDWTASYEASLYVVKAVPDKGVPFLSLSYIGSLPGLSVTLNAYGIAFSGNSVLKGHQYGVPKSIILRSQIEAKSIRGFARLASFSPRAIPAHTMAVDKKGRIVSVELSLDKHSIYYTTKPFVHTNHAILNGLKELEPQNSEEDYKDSVLRLETAQRYLKEREVSAELMKDILRSHDNSPNYSICSHLQEGYDDVTVGSAIVNISEMSMAVLMGNPCSSEYQKYYL